MGKLDELREGLYGKDASVTARRGSRPGILPRSGIGIGRAWEEKSGKSGNGILGNGFKKLSFYLVGTSLFFIAGGAVVVWLYLGRGMPQAAIRIQSRDSLEAGEIFSIPVVLANSSKVALQNVELVLTLPPASRIQAENGEEQAAPPRILKYVEDLSPGEQQTVTLVTRMFGREGEALPVIADLSYKPENLRARFSSREVKEIKVTSVPLAFSWEAPDTVSEKQDIVLRARIRSSARAALDRLWVQVEYPSGFAFASGEPKPNLDNNKWDIGELADGDETTIEIRGTLTGTAGEMKAFRGGVGAFNPLTKEWRPWRESVKEFGLSATPLFLDVAAQGRTDNIVSPGDNLKFVLRYRNNSGVPLRNVSVRSVLKGDVVDPASIRIGEGGVFDSQSQALVWNPGSTPDLRIVDPGSGGELSFDVGLKPRPVVRNEADKNLTVKVRGDISVASVPKELEGVKLDSSDEVELKVRSIILFSGRSLSRTSPIPGGGPTPPKVGQKTVYTVVWEARNFTNDLSGVEVRAPLPPNVKWEGKIYPGDSGIMFDAASSEVRWRIGTVAAGIGVTSPGLTGAFHVSVTPSQADVGKSLTILGESRLVAHDRFTDEDREERVEPLTMETREDTLTNSEDWAVVK